MSTTLHQDEELQQIRELAREFARGELRPHVERWDHERALDPQVLDHLAELGFFGMLVPEEHGGMEFTLPTYLAALEELAWGEPGVALTLSIHSAFAVTLLLRHGTDAQKSEWLPRLATGEARACVAISEEQAGSDPSAVRTRARREGEGWVLSGAKKWVTNGRTATVAVVLARLDDDDASGSEGEFGLFLVPTSASGWSAGKRETTMGFRPLEVVAVELDDVTLPAEALIGQPGRGLALALEGLDTGRLGVAAQSVGIARAALEHALAYADQRQQFGKSIRSFEGIQFKLADMAARVDAARSLLAEAGAAPSTRTAATAKLFASETAMWVTTQAVQVFGGYGYMRDYPVEKLMRDAKATEIYEGTSEILRVVIARELYR